MISVAITVCSPKAKKLMLTNCSAARQRFKDKMGQTQSNSDSEFSLIFHFITRLVIFHKSVCSCVSRRADGLQVVKQKGNIEKISDNKYNIHV